MIHPIRGFGKAKKFEEPARPRAAPFGTRACLTPQLSAVAYGPNSTNHSPSSSIPRLASSTILRPSGEMDQSLLAIFKGG
jgi:hypothetical protein